MIAVRCGFAFSNVLHFGKASSLVTVSSLAGVAEGVAEAPMAPLSMLRGKSLLLQVASPIPALPVNVEVGVGC